jgi:hypothetical protein
VEPTSTNIANRATTNPAMSMQLPATDPYSILHANCWGNPNKESDFIKRLSINVPTENNLSILEKREVRVLDFGSDCLILPDRTSKVLIRDEYIELWKHVEEECHSLRRRFGGVVLTGHPGIGTLLASYHPHYSHRCGPDRKIVRAILLSPSEPVSGPANRASNRYRQLLPLRRVWRSPRTLHIKHGDLRYPISSEATWLHGRDDRVGGLE